jgi:hypothetical protein
MSLPAPALAPGPAPQTVFHELRKLDEGTLVTLFNAYDE